MIAPARPHYPQTTVVVGIVCSTLLLLIVLNQVVHSVPM